MRGNVPHISFPEGYNRVAEIGLAVGADDVGDAGFVLKVPSGGDHSAVLCCNVMQWITDEEKKLWVSTVGFIFKNGWWAPDSKLITITDDNLRVLNSAADIAAIGFLPSQDVANMLVALKLTWWVTNHHIGQNKSALQGFIQKVAAMSGYSEDGKCSELTRTILWVAGKLLSTVSVLDALGP